MLSPETLESYRKMTPSERLRMTFASMYVNEPYLFVGTNEQIDRKFQRIEEENHKRNFALLTELGRSLNVEKLS